MRSTPRSPRPFPVHASSIAPRWILLLLGLALCAGAASAQIDVTATAGNTGPVTYATLKLAFDAVNDGTHQGVVTMAVTADTTETAPAVLNASGSGAASYSSVTISPTGGGARTITGAIAAGSPLIDLNGADNVTIDGVNSGGNALTLSNTTASATSGTSTVRFIGGATGNVLTNLSILGSFSATVGTNGGNVYFATDAVTASGNDGNTISNSNIGPAGANLPTKGIYCNGSTTTAALGNSGITVTGNNVYDYFGAAVASAGVYLGGGCSGWTITGNRFYQTGTRTWTTGANNRAIDIQNSTSTTGAQGFTITGNIIGYASAAGTGTYSLTGSTGKFAGIVFNGLTGGALSSISSNTVTAVSLSGVTSSGTSTSSPFIGILVTNGLADTNGNVIGALAGTGALTFSTNTTTSTDVYGIFNFSVDNWTANSNTIGAFTASNAGATGAFIFYGMRANTSSSVAFNASANLVGGAAANSIQNGSVSTTAQTIGMFTSNARANWTGNTVRNLTGAGGTGTSASASVLGMVNTGTTATGQLISQNTIYSLGNTSVSAATTVIGIQYTGPTTGTNLVTRNLIHSFTAASATAILNGVNVSGGTTTYANNMIRLGVDAAGAAITTGLAINGFSEPLGTDTIVHNSIWVGGSGVGGSAATYAFNSQQTVNARSFQDNVFVNARSNGAGTGKHYAVRVGGSTPNPTGLTINYNVYQATGVGAVFGFFNAADVASLAAWRTAVGQDAASIDMDPQFLAPAAATPDLHINPVVTTPIEGNGVAIGSVTDDFDGQARAGLTPTDIGADAGNFLGVDLAPPAIAFTPLGNTSLTASRTVIATMTDVTGVATGGLAPRVYFRKNAGAYISQACSLTSGTVNNGSWDCVIDPTLLGGVTIGDVVGYFVIAQDTAAPPNIGSNPSGAVATDVNNVSSPPGAPATYTILPGISGGKTLCASGCDYSSLTNAGGVFEAINNSALTGNLVIDVTSDLSGELGTVALNQWAEDGAGGYTLLIRPSGAPRTITGTNAGALVRLNGADRVRLDGSTAATFAPDAGGDPAPRELTLQNTNTGTSAVVLAVQSGSNGAQNNTLKNLILVGQDPVTTLAVLALGGNTPGTLGTDNDGNRVENCAIRRAIYGIYSGGQNATNPNTGSVITRNDLAATGGDRIRRIGIVVFNEDGVQITENSVGGIDTNESADALGIGVGTQSVDATTTTGGGVVNALVARNRVNGVNSASTVGFSAAGIAVAGGTAGANTIVNNMVSGVISPATAPDLVAGVFVAGVSGSTTRIYANSVLMSGDRGAVASQTPSFALAVTGVDPAVVLRDNALATSQTSGGGTGAKSYAIGMVTTTFANLDSNYNAFYSTGANAGFFRSGSLAASAGTDYPNLAGWAAAVSDDAASLEVDPLYVSTTDLHLQTSSTLLNAGVAVPAVADDFDGQPRPPATPDIGADELVQADLAITKDDGVASVIPGGTTTYTIVATNLGASHAPGATVTDTFPGTLSCSTTCVATVGASCTAGPFTTDINDTVNLPAGASVTYTSVCNVSGAASGSIVNTASVAPPAGVSDPNAANDSATDTDTVGALLADLAITKNDGATTATPGTLVNYTIVASNAGPSPVASATVADTFPAALSGCSTTCVGTGGATCTAGPVSGNLNDTAGLPAGTSVTYTSVCTISATATGSLSNTATVSSAVSDPNPANNSANDTDTLVPESDLAITKTDGVTTVVAGQSTTYTITASNPGPSAAPAATVTDNFPAACTSVNWTCSGSVGGTCASSGSGNISDTADLPVGGSVTYTAVCAISNAASGTLVNTATVSIGAADPNPTNNSATDTDTILPAAIFSDGFESGDTSAWSVTVPFTLPVLDSGPVALESGVAVLDYDFASLPSGTPHAPCDLVRVVDAAGETLLAVQARRVGADHVLELALATSGTVRGAWAPVAGIEQQLRLEWVAAAQGYQGHLALYLDGRLAQWIDGFAPSGSNARVEVLGVPAANGD